MTDKQNNLGPLTPHSAPRKSAKNVLAGLVAAAGIAGGTAMFVASGSASAQVARPRMGGMPPMRKIQTTQPATQPVQAVEAKIAGGMPAVRVAPTTKPADADPATKPATMPATAPAEIKIAPKVLAGLVAADQIEVKPAPTTEPAK